VISLGSVIGNLIALPAMVSLWGFSYINSQEEWGP
jgi:hypothetical protein